MKIVITKNELVRQIQSEKIMLLCKLHQEMNHRVILREIYFALYEIPKNILFDYTRDTMIYFSTFHQLSTALKENRTKAMIKIIEMFVRTGDIFDCAVYINLLHLLKEYNQKEQIKYVEEI